MFQLSKPRTQRTLSWGCVRSIRRGQDLLAHIPVALLVACLLASLSTASTCSAGQFASAGNYYDLLTDATKVFKMPEATDAEKAAKFQQLEGIAARSRGIWNANNMHEGKDPIPTQSGGITVGQAGTALDMPYRPRIIDMYANWKRARLAPDADQRKSCYQEVLLSLPPAFEAWGDQSPYAHPAVFAMVVDANLHLGESSSKPTRAWVDSIVGENASKQKLERYLHKYNDRRALMQIPVCFPADQLWECYGEIRTEVKTALSKARVKDIALENGASPGDTPKIHGMLEAAQPMLVWAAKPSGEVVDSKRTVSPGTSFSIPLSTLKAGESGEVVVCWSLPDDGLGKAFDLPTSWMSEQRFAYQIAEPPKPNVGFQTNAAKLVVVSTDDGKNRDQISIPYSFSPAAKTFDWKIVGEDGVEAFAKKDDKLIGTLDLPAGALPLKKQEKPFYYKLVVRNDPEKDVYDPTGVEIRVAPPGVALLIGIDAYQPGQIPLRHACDDVNAYLAMLGAAGYTGEDIIWIKGEHGKASGNPMDAVIKTNGIQVQNSKQYWVTPNVLKDGLLQFRRLIDERKPSRAVFFYSGHGETKTDDKGNVSDVLVAARQTDTTESDVYLNQVMECAASKAFTSGTSGTKCTFVTLLDACRVNTSQAGVVTRQEIAVNRDSGVLEVPVYSCNIGEASNDPLDIDYLDSSGTKEKVQNGFFTFAITRGVADAVDCRLGPVLAKAIPIMDKLMGKAATIKGPNGEAIYSTSQTITVGSRPLPSVDKLGDLPEDQRSIRLY